MATRSGTLRRTAALALLACGATLLIAPAMAGADIAPEKGDSAITIEQTVSPDQGDCQSSLLALKNTAGETATTFALRILVSAPLCDPITATAVVYAMPGDGVAWPQQLVETKDFVIREAGVITVTFAKTCNPVQFDVLVGATPRTIDPLGEWHGPLLFPLDTGTSLQYFGCTSPTTTENTSTTSSAPSTTGSAPSTTSSTVPVSVDSATTIKPGIAAVTTPAPAAVAVAGTSPTRSANASALALTGTTSAWFLGLGLVLLTLGGLMFFGSRRRLATVDTTDEHPTAN